MAAFSWLNPMKRWFTIVIQKSVSRVGFASVEELIAKIEPFVAPTNQAKVLFIRTTIADSLLEKL